MPATPSSNYRIRFENVESFEQVSLLYLEIESNNSSEYGSAMVPLVCSRDLILSLLEI
jgi:hypothetical protein